MSAVDNRTPAHEEKGTMSDQEVFCVFDGSNYSSSASAGCRAVVKTQAKAEEAVRALQNVGFAGAFWEGPFDLDCVDLAAEPESP